MQASGNAAEGEVLSGDPPREPGPGARRARASSGPAGPGHSALPKGRCGVGIRQESPARGRARVGERCRRLECHIKAARDRPPGPQGRRRPASARPPRGGGRRPGCGGRGTWRRRPSPPPTHHPPASLEPLLQRRAEPDGPWPGPVRVCLPTVGKPSRNRHTRRPAAGRFIPESSGRPRPERATESRRFRPAHVRVLGPDRKGFQ
jgi:hypothetical protein